MALATGASDVSSHHIGTTVTVGMASVAILGSLFIPSFYAMIAHISAWLQRKMGIGDHDERRPAIENDER